MPQARCLRPSRAHAHSLEPILHCVFNTAGMREAVEMLMAMGYSAERSRRALQVSGANDINGALDFLLSEAAIDNAMQGEHGLPCFCDGKSCLGSVLECCQGQKIMSGSTSKFAEVLQ